MIIYLFDTFLTKSFHNHLHAPCYTHYMYLNFREWHVQHDWAKWQQEDCSWKELFLCLFLTTKLHWTEKTHAAMHTGHFVQILLPPLEVIIFEGQGQGLCASSLEVPCSYISWNFLLLKITWEIALFQLQSQEPTCKYREVQGSCK